MAKIDKRTRRVEHKRQKSRHKVNKILLKYDPTLVFLSSNERKETMFREMMAELLLLNVKHLQVLLYDLQNSFFKSGWTGEYHSELKRTIESSIMERTLLK